jgi:hypothetical protein
MTDGSAVGDRASLIRTDIPLNGRIEIIHIECFRSPSGHISQVGFVINPSGDFRVGNVQLNFCDEMIAFKVLVPGIVHLVKLTFFLRKH